MIKDDKPDLILAGHRDTVTGLSLNPDGTHLVSNSMDCTLRVWDIRPFAINHDNNSRCERMLYGVHHGAEKLLLRCSWSNDGEYITAGSADRIVHLWETTNYQEVCGWPGHKASVNEVIIHPTEPILASCSSDRSIVLGEFTPQ
jgi:Prp8 binding protein